MAVKSVFERTSSTRKNQIKCNFQLLKEDELKLIEHKTKGSLPAATKLSKHLAEKKLPVSTEEIINTLHNFRMKDIIEINQDLDSGNIKVLIKGDKKVITEKGKKFYLYTFVVWSLTTRSIVTCWIGKDKRSYADNFIKIDVRKMLKKL